LRKRVRVYVGVGKKKEETFPCGLRDLEGGGLEEAFSTEKGREYNIEIRKDEKKGGKKNPNPAHGEKKGEV